MGFAYAFITPAVRRTDDKDATAERSCALGVSSWIFYIISSGASLRLPARMTSVAQAFQWRELLQRQSLLNLHLWQGRFCLAFLKPGMQPLPLLLYFRCTDAPFWIRINGGLLCAARLIDACILILASWAGRVDPHTDVRTADKRDAWPVGAGITTGKFCAEFNTVVGLKFSSGKERRSSMVKSTGSRHDQQHKLRLSA